MRKTVLLLFVLMTQGVFASTLRLASPFTNSMVLQRNLPIQVWGEAEPGSELTIYLNNREVSTISDKDGKWKATIPKQKAGGPYRFTVESGSEKIELNDVMIGEVWICSGQSNMFMSYRGIPELVELKDRAKEIRTFTFKNSVAFTEQEYIDGEWEKEVPNSAVALSFAYHLQEAIDVPVGIILTSWGSSSIEGWMPRDMVDELPHFRSIMSEFDNDIDKRAKIDSIMALESRSVRGDIILRTQPNIIYNAMMKPFAPYSCRGVVWYQGEANAGKISKMEQYGRSLPKWILRLRKDWSDQEFHFIGVMLPGFGGQLKPLELTDSLMQSPEALSWAWMRESQCKALELPNTAIANTIDLGLKTNIHPKDKLPVGQRLALLARESCLNENIIADGPIFKSVRVRKNSLVVNFKSAKGLKTIDNKSPKAFWICDSSGEWVEADAKISGSSVILSSVKVDEPKYVRYAFSAMPRVNLVNEVELPARPFRTDNFPPK